MANHRREPTKVIRVPEALLDDIQEMIAEHRSTTRGNELTSGEITFVRTKSDDIVDSAIDNKALPLAGRLSPNTA